MVQAMKLPLEDNFEDLIGKAQKGLKFTDEALAFRAGIPVASLTLLKQGTLLEGPLRQVAPLLNLHPETLLAIARKTWLPAPVEVTGLLHLNTHYAELDMTVNHFIVFDPASKTAAIFDTGTDPAPTLAAVAEHGLQVESIFITHTHVDHVLALPALRAAFPQAVVYCGRGENLAVHPGQLGLEIGPGIPRVGEGGAAPVLLVDEVPRRLDDLGRASGFVASGVTADEQRLVGA